MVHITFPTVTDDYLFLLIRAIIGFSFLVSARNKGRNIEKFAKSNSLPVLVAILVMTIEFLAGSALILGVLSQFAALALMLLMIGTIRLHIFKWKSPYWANKGGWEYDIMLFTMASVIAVFGAGSIALLS